MDFIELNDQLVYVFSVYDSPGFQLQNLSVQKPMLYLAVSCNCSWALSIEGFNPSHWNLANVKDDIAGWILIWLTDGDQTIINASKLPTNARYLQY